MCILTLFLSLQIQQLFAAVEKFMKLEKNEYQDIPFLQCAGNRFAFIVDVLFPEVTKVIAS